MVMLRSTFRHSRSTLSLTSRTMLALIGCVIVGHLVAVPGGVSLMGPFRGKFFPGKQKKGQQNEDPYCMFNDQLLALYGTSIFLAGLPACLASAFVTRKYGHKVSIFLGALLAATGVVPEILARDTATLLAGRLVQGFGFGFLNQAISPYLAEMAPAGRRGALVCAVQVLTKAGALLTNTLNLFLIKYGKEHGWKLSLSVILFLLAAPLICASICVLPDTPHRLILTKKDDKGAERLLQQIRKTLDVRAELEVIKAGASMEITFIGSLKLLLEKKYRPTVLTGIFIPIFTQLTGVNMFGPIMFKAVGFSPVYAILIEITSSFCSCMSTGGMMYHVDKQGRRVFLISGGALMFVSLILLGAIETTGLGGGSAQDVLCIMMIVLYVIGFGASWGPLGVLIPSEIYPSEIRSVGLGISVTMSFTLSALIGCSYLPLLCRLRYGIFFVLAAAVFVVTAWVLVFLPETRGTPLEQMQRVWSGHWFWQKFMHQENNEELELGNMPDAGSLSDYTMDSPPLSQSNNGQDNEELELGNMPDAGPLSEDTVNSPPISQSTNGHGHIGDQPRLENNPGLQEAFHQPKHVGF